MRNNRLLSEIADVYKGELNMSTGLAMVEFDLTLEVVDITSNCRSARGWS